MRTLVWAQSLRPRFLALRLCIFLLFFILPLRAETVESVPDPLRTRRSWVSDVAQVIDANNELQINRTIENLQKRTTAEIAVVTVNSADGSTPKEFATALFNRWGVGKKGKDNGVLILLVMQSRRVEVETGYGVEGDLPDATVGEMLREQAVPRFKQGDFGGGLLRVVGEISRILSGGAVSAPAAAPPVTINKPRAANPGAGSRSAPIASVPRFSPPAEPPDFAPPYNPPVVPISPLAGLIGILMLLMFPLGAGLLIWGIVLIVRRMNTRHCPQCRRAMRYLNEQEDDAFLDEAQIFEERLGGLDWRVWRCDACAVQHIERSVKWFGGYEDCPQCGHHTVQLNSINLREPTYTREGLRETTKTCQFPNCGYHHRSQQRIPRRQRQSNAVIVSGGGGSFGGSSRSSGGGGFSSSSGGFGGGSSGGGGAGANW